nr:hypothetical protein [Tanacetum cinerariifolium]
DGSYPALSEIIGMELVWFASSFFETNEFRIKEGGRDRERPSRGTLSLIALFPSLRASRKKSISFICLNQYPLSKV